MYQKNKNTPGDLRDVAASVAANDGRSLKSHAVI
jgi:hypothetical protein